MSKYEPHYGESDSPFLDYARSVGRYQLTFGSTCMSKYEPHYGESDSPFLDYAWSFGRYQLTFGSTCMLSTSLTKVNPTLRSRTTRGASAGM